MHPIHRLQRLLFQDRKVLRKVAVDLQPSRRRIALELDVGSLALSEGPAVVTHAHKHRLPIIEEIDDGAPLLDAVQHARRRLRLDFLPLIVFASAAILFSASVLRLAGLLVDHFVAEPLDGPQPKERGISANLVRVNVDHGASQSLGPNFLETARCARPVDASFCSFGLFAQQPLDVVLLVLAAR